MSHVNKQKIGKYNYVYVTDCVWNPIKMRSERIVREVIGKIDSDTGEILYTSEYLKKLDKEGESTEGLKTWSLKTIQYHKKGD
jgi:hypothetical protein